MKRIDYYPFMCIKFISDNLHKRGDSRLSRSSTLQVALEQMVAFADFW